MSSKEDLSASVPILVGPNWIIWEAQMKAYLRTKGLWQLVTSGKQVPAFSSFFFLWIYPKEEKGRKKGSFGSFGQKEEKG